MKRFCLYKILAFVSNHTSGNSGTGRLAAVCLLGPSFCPQCTPRPTPTPKHPIFLFTLQIPRATCTRHALMIVLLCVLFTSRCERASAVFVVARVVCNFKL